MAAEGAPRVTEASVSSEEEFPEGALTTADQERGVNAISSDLVMLSDPGGVAAESIRQLRTRIIAQHVNRGRRALAFCSPDANGGCSFIAANVAVAFAQIGTRVLLMNADLRTGRADAMFGVGGEADGLRQYLTSAQATPDCTIQHEVLPSLSFVSSGGIAPNAQELLSSARFETFFNKSLREFDLTLINTPPANLYADSQRIASIAGFAVIVGRSHRTYFDDVSELTRQLVTDRVTVVGSILYVG